MPNLFDEFGILEVVGILGLLLGIQVVEGAVKFFEAVNGRKMLVAIAEVILAELRGDVALLLEQIRDGRIFLLKAFLRSGQTDFQEAGAERRLARDESGPSRGAALLTIGIGEHSAFLGEAVDVGSLVAHHALIVRTDIPIADVVAPDDEDVRLALLGVRTLECCP